MRRTLSVLIVAAVLVVRTPLGAEDLVYTRFGDYLEALRIQAGIPGLAAVLVDRNAIQWERAYGSDDLERGIATRTDSPMHVDGLTETFTAALVLRCVEEGRLSLDDQIAKFKADSPDAGATIGEVLTHTSGSPEGLIYAYRPERLESLNVAIRACTGDSFRETLANLFDRLAMADSVPGPDVIRLVPPAEGILTSEVARYTSVLDRLAVPYAVDSQRRASPSQYSATTLTPTKGIVTTALDLAKFDLGLKNGVVLETETLASAWRAPLGADGRRLPHGMGWFVQTYNGENVVWQFGTGENGSSSLMITWPTRSLTLILVANSTGLARTFQLSDGEVTTSPFGRVFLATFIR